MTNQNPLGATNAPIQVLLVEKSQDEAEFVTVMLNRSPEMAVKVDHVTSLGEAMTELARRPYDIVLLDLDLPDSTGTESVSRLRDCSPSTPIIVLTDDDRSGTARAAIESGAQDILSKLHVVGQLLTRMVQHAIARNHQLIQVQSEALVDVLTGHANRRACAAELERRLSDFARYKHPFCVALFDIDHFKQVNDRWGHETGDRVIQAVADALADHSRPTDQLARYGGEEFAITFPATRLDDAGDLVLGCHHAVSQLVIGNQDLRVTVSAGIAEINEQDDGGSLFARADQALYAAKLAGRNCCMPSSDPRTIARSKRPAKVSSGK
jgi:two-component system cell cycle response regulator